MNQKTAEKKAEILKRWHSRCTLRKMQALLPEGYVLTNKNPVQKEIRRIDSMGYSQHWSSWAKKDNEKFLILLIEEHNQVKILSESDLKGYSIHSLKI